MTKPLLIEIAVEELPAIPFLKELKNIEKKWNKILEENGLVCEYEFFYTPRRLVFWHREFKVKTDDKKIELSGAPVAIAFKDGEPTGAAHGFAKKCGVSIDELQTKETPKGPILYFEKVEEGIEVKELLNGMINQFIKALDFGKSMRWGSNSESFIRPIRGLSILLGEELIEASLFDVVSSKTSFAHRMVSYEKFAFNDGKEYFDLLSQKGVVLYPDERKKIILDGIKEIETQHNIEVEIDSELLDEVVAITEYPTPLLGGFDEEFLELPDEVIVNSMKEHQRYFAVYKDGKITNKFIVVSNAYTQDFSEIISGNEKVLRPRLSDAMFFWRNDIKNGLSNEGLKKLTYVEGLGSVYDKSVREAKIGAILADMLGCADKKLIEETIMLAKADLMTDMVYEFTELQGLMGYYYANIAKMDAQMALGFKEQYLPAGEESALPSTLFSSIVSMSNKIDALMGIFSIGKIPSGSRDPFALRRAASAIVKICITNEYHLDFYKLVDSLASGYPNLDTKQLKEFFNDRLYKIFEEVNPTVIKAVLASGEGDLVNISNKINALNPIVTSDDFSEYSATFKRIANIIKDIDTEQELSVVVDLFEDDEENELYEAYITIKNNSYTSIDEELDALFNLKPTLDRFFDNVFVNHENEAIKTNRKNLVGIVYQGFKQIADIKEITL
jgi:glycyl-tRNA synthetase beta chain